jgi:cellulose biosynthesis protein BcsQ
MAATKRTRGPHAAVAFANTKGGCAKTTLIANLGVRAASDGANVALLDYDPQQSLARWWELRGDQLFNPRLIKTDEQAGICRAAAQEHRGPIGSSRICRQP